MEIIQSTPPILFARIAILIFFAILFLQSGWDKVRDRKGNLEWMVPHFANSPFKKLVPLLLTIVTVVELSAGAACVIALFSGATAYHLVPFPNTAHISSSPLMNLAMCVVSLALLQLFLGQRIAKDYPGAASLAGYFGIAILGFWVAMPWNGPNL